MSGTTKVEKSDKPVTQLIWTDELIRRFWDGVGCTHLDDLSFGRLAGSKFLRLISEYLPVSAEICDFGAGGGHFAEALLQAGFATAVYEPSPRRNQALLEKLSGYDRFLGITGPDEGRLFDVVIMAEVIEHLPDRLLQQTLDGAKRLLRSGGTMIVTTPNDEDIGQAQVLCPVCRQIFHPWQHLRSFTHQSLEDYLSSQGFRRRFLGLIDFSDDAAAIDHSRLFAPLFEFMELLNSELAEFARHLPPDGRDGFPPKRHTGSVYATDTLQFEHGLIFAELARLRARSETHINAIHWPNTASKIPVVLSQMCDGFYSRVQLLIDAQHKVAQIRELTRRIGEIVDRFRSLDRTVGDAGTSGLLQRRGLGFLRAGVLRVNLAAKFGWEFLRDPTLLVDAIRLPRVLADYTRAISAAREGCKLEVWREEPCGGVRFATTGASGAAEAVLVHLRSIAERIERALSACAPASARERSGSGYDVYLGKGSSILYVGEKLRA